MFILMVDNPHLLLRNYNNFLITGKRMKSTQFQHLYLLLHLLYYQIVMHFLKWVLNLFILLTDNTLWKSVQMAFSCVQRVKTVPIIIYILIEKFWLRQSPFPSNENSKIVYYEVPPRHVPQLLAEMKAYDCSEIWFVCSIQRSCTVISVTFDEDLWMSMWSLVLEFYDAEKPKMQMWVHPQNSELHLRINNFIR